MRLVANEETAGSIPAYRTMQIKSKCPQCGEIVTKKWKMSPVLMRCSEGHPWHPRQDILSAVYVHKSMSEKEYLGHGAG